MADIIDHYFLDYIVHEVLSIAISSDTTITPTIRNGVLSILVESTDHMHPYLRPRRYVFPYGLAHAANQEDQQMAYRNANLWFASVQDDYLSMLNNPPRYYTRSTFRDMPSV